MDKEKHIEEMAKATMKHCKIDNQCGSCHWSTCNECLSEVLYNAGYRKQSEVAREIFEDCHNTLIKILNTVRDGLDKAIREDNEDAKLVHIGTEEIVKCIILIFAELKKKYTKEITEEGK